MHVAWSGKAGGHTSGRELHESLGARRKRNGPDRGSTEITRPFLTLFPDAGQSSKLQVANDKYPQVGA